MRDLANLNTVEWKGKVVGPNTNSEQTLTLARGWLRQCTSSHPECDLEKLGLTLPSRLLALHPLGTNITLVDTCTMTSTPKYMTLSHCWGKAEFLTLRTSTYDMLQAGINVSILPRTFRDAIQVALELGGKYLVSIACLPTCYLGSIL